MAEKVTKVGVKRQDGYLYFIDKAAIFTREISPALSMK